MSAPEEFCLSRAIQMFTLLLLLLYKQLYTCVCWWRALNLPVAVDRSTLRDLWRRRCWRLRWGIYTCVCWQREMQLHSVHVRRCGCLSPTVQ